MKKLFLVICALQSIFSSTTIIGELSPWRKLTGPCGTTALCSTVHPNGKIFIGTQNDGVYSSSDGGNSWQHKWNYHTKTIAPIINSISINNDGIIYFSDQMEGWVFKSTDDGETWNKCNFPISLGNAFSVSAGEDKDVYVGTARGIYLSKDGGENWTKIFECDAIVRNIVIKNNIIYATVDQCGLVTSKDDGKNWKFSRLPLSYYWSLLVVSEDEIYVTLNGCGFDMLFERGIYITYNGGDSWIKSENGLGDENIFTVTSNSKDEIFAAGSQGRVFRSSDKGTTWTMLTEKLIASTVRALAVIENDIVGVANEGGAIVSHDNGISWSIKDEGFGPLKTLWLVKLPDENIMMLNSEGFFVIDRTNGKLESAKGLNSLLPNFISVLSDSSLITFTYDGEIYKSKTVSGPWERIPLSLSPSQIIAIARVQDGKLFFSAISGDKGQYSSTDMGETWQRTNYLFAYCNAVINDNNGDLLANNVKWLYRSKDNGVTWDIINNFETILTSMWKTSSGSIFIMSESAGFLRSDDNGANWDFISLGENSSREVIQSKQIVEIENSLLMSTSNGIYQSSDDGKSWTLREDEMKGVLLRLFKYSDESLYAITDEGIYTSELSTASIEKEQKPFEFSLSQNYPNPFNPTTTINYQVPKDGIVTLKVYDVLGKEVETLVNTYKSTGDYKVEFNAGNLSSGVYFYRLSSDNLSQSKKMLLVK